MTTEINEDILEGEDMVNLEELDEKEVLGDDDEEKISTIITFVLKNNLYKSNFAERRNLMGTTSMTRQSNHPGRSMRNENRRKCNPRCRVPSFNRKW